jgi:drug/metabolite transporter (DMT)-like permease
LISIVHVLVPLASWAVLAEKVSAARWAGIALVFAGIILIARDAAKVEKKL